MSGPPLAQARATAESVMADTIRFTRPAAGPQDGWRDEAELTDVPPAGAPVYEGPAMVRPEKIRANPQREGGAVIYDQDYRVRIPVTAPEVRRGDVGVVVESSADPQIVGKPLTVIRVDAGTHAVTRMILCRAEGRGPDL